MKAQLANMETLLSSEKYQVTLSVLPKAEISLWEYLKNGIHTDEKYGPFTDTDSLFASLDA